MKIDLFDKGNINNNYDPSYLEYIDAKNQDEKKQHLNHLFNENKRFLDNDFATSFQQDFRGRLWELFILERLLNSPYKNNLLESKKNRPDFVIENFYSGKKIYIECVHPRDNGEKNITSGSSFCLDHHIVTRFTNSLNQKAKQYCKWLASSSIAQGDYRVLCISAITLYEAKAKTHDNGITIREFNAAVSGGEEAAIFEKDTRKMKRLHLDFCVEKSSGNKINMGQFSEDNEIFDVIIYSENNTFFSSKDFNIAYKNEEIEEKLKESLEQIFKN